MIYLDNAATTPVDPNVVSAMTPYFTEKFGNTASLHSIGQEANEALEESRQKLAGFLGAEPTEIIFTASATESNNLALKGLAFANDKKHIIISAVEHDCILNSTKWLENQGFEITKVKVDKYGMVNPEDIKNAIKEDTLLVSVMHANNEIGTINPINEIGEVCRAKGVYFHTDAAQSFGKIPINIGNIDLLTASSQKMYGPKGAAFLFVRKGVKIEPILHGGGHESGLRSSTVNVAAIVGFAKAAELCFKNMEKELEKQEGLRNYLIKKLLKIDGCYLNGHPEKRLPNNINVRFDFVEGEAIVMKLDAEGIAASTGSACSSPKLEPSHVLLACGVKHEQAHGSLRLSLGRWTTKKDVEFAAEKVKKVIEGLREISPFKKDV